MANENKKEELLLTQEILQNQRDIVLETEKSYGILKKNQMARKEVVDLAREVSKFAEEENAFQNEASKSLRSKSELLSAQAKLDQFIVKNKTMQNDLISKMGGETDKLSKKDQRRLSVLQNQITTHNAIRESINKQIKARVELNDKLGVADNILRGMNKIPFLGKFIDSESILARMETSFLKDGNYLKAMAEAAKELKAQMKGAASMTVFTTGLTIGWKMLSFMVTSMFKLNKLTTKLSNELGISYENASKLQTELHGVATASGLAYINAETLNKALIETTKHTGIMSQTLGTNFLKTFITFTDRMGMATKEAEKLSFLTRLQSKDTRSVVKDQIASVNQYNKQNKTAFTAVGILKSMGSASSDVVVSLGMGVDELTNATIAATSLGTTLDTIASIADGLLNFEQSIGAEMELSLALGESINLGKERELALNNKLGKLGESLMSQEKILNAFRTGNRVVQDLAAAAMGVQREVLADMIMMQDKKMLSEEEFLEIYGEQTVKNIEALTAQEELNKSIEKMKVRLMEAFKPLVPIIEGFSSIVASILESKVGLGVMLSLMGGLAARSITIAIATALTAAFNPANPANIASLGLAGLAVGAILTGAIYATVASAEGSVPSADIEDDFMSRNGVITSFNKDDLIIGGTSLLANQNSGNKAQGSNNIGMEELKSTLKSIEDYLKTPLSPSTHLISYDSFSKNASDRDLKYKSNFA